MRVGDHRLDAAKAAPGELAQERGPERLGFRRADIHAENLAPAIGIDADRNDHRHRDDASLAAHLHVGGVDPQVRPVALDRAMQEGLHLVVDLRAQPADLAFGDAAHPHRLDQIVDRAGRNTLHIGFLDHRGERLLGHPPRLQEAGEVRALAQLGNTQLDRAGAGLPIAVAIAVALHQALNALLAVARARHGADLQLHQTLGRKTDHLAQQIGIRGLLHERAQVHHLVGHRWLLESGWSSQPDPTDESPVATAKPAARHGAMGARVRPASLPPCYTTPWDATYQRLTELARMCWRQAHRTQDQHVARLPAQDGERISEGGSQIRAANCPTSARTTKRCQRSRFSTWLSIWRRPFWSAIFLNSV